MLPHYSPGDHKHVHIDADLQWLKLQWSLELYQPGLTGFFFRSARSLVTDNPIYFIESVPLIRVQLMLIYQSLFQWMLKEVASNTQDNHLIPLDLEEAVKLCKVQLFGLGLLACPGTRSLLKHY